MDEFLTAVPTWLALVVSLAAYGLMFVLLRLLPAARVASLTYLSPPVTMVMAWLVFGETLTLAGIIGLAIAAAAVALTLTAHRPEAVGNGERAECGTCPNRNRCLDPAPVH